MDSINDPDFLQQQQRALERMREMSERSQFKGETHKMPPTPPFVKVPQTQNPTNHFVPNGAPAQENRQNTQNRSAQPNGNYANRSGSNGQTAQNRFNQTQAPNPRGSTGPRGPHRQNQNSQNQNAHNPNGQNAQGGNRTESRPTYKHERSEEDSFIFPGLNIPLLSKLKLDPDIALILGMILILANEKTDRKLILALLYILI